MINIYCDNSHPFESLTSENQNLLQDAVWIDLLNPTLEDKKTIEHALSIAIPTRAEMQEIELSSRLYEENGNLYMTLVMIANSDSPDPKVEPITLVLTPQRLITIRYIEPHSFNLLISKLKKMPNQRNPIILLIELLDVTVDRLADILENVGQRLDETSYNIFRSKKYQKSLTPEKYRTLLQLIGSYGDLNSKVRESLITINLLVPFFEQRQSEKINQSMQSQLNTISKDLYSLSDHADFISTKVNFLLEATLGLINIDQNNTIKIVSVAAVVFLPPTLIASIYGMNFKFMPELSWYLGYPIAIGLMALAAWLPYRLFKRRGWI